MGHGLALHGSLLVLGGRKVQVCGLCLLHQIHPGTDGLQHLNEWESRWATTIVLDHVGEALEHFCWTWVYGQNFFFGFLEFKPKGKKYWVN